MILKGVPSLKIHPFIGLVRLTPVGTGVSREEVTSCPKEISLCEGCGQGCEGRGAANQVNSLWLAGYGGGELLVSLSRGGGWYGGQAPGGHWSCRRRTWKSGLLGGVWDLMVPGRAERGYDIFAYQAPAIKRSMRALAVNTGEGRG